MSMPMMSSNELPGWPTPAPGYRFSTSRSIGRYRAGHHRIVLARQQAAVHDRMQGLARPSFPGGDVGHVAHGQPGVADRPAVPPVDNNSTRAPMRCQFERPVLSERQQCPADLPKGRAGDQESRMGGGDC
jgi:hypothetical protein